MIARRFILGRRVGIQHELRKFASVMACWQAQHIVRNDINKQPINCVLNTTQERERPDWGRNLSVRYLGSPIHSRKGIQLAAAAYIQ